MAQPSTPGGTSYSIFGSGSASTPTHTNQFSEGLPTTPGPDPSSNTFLMPNSPVKNRLGMDGYRPKVTRTLGQVIYKSSGTLTEYFLTHL